MIVLVVMIDGCLVTNIKQALQRLKIVMIASTRLKYATIPLEVVVAGYDWTISYSYEVH